MTTSGMTYTTMNAQFGRMNVPASWMIACGCR